MKRRLSALENITAQVPYTKKNEHKESNSLSASSNWAADSFWLELHDGSDMRR